MFNVVENKDLDVFPALVYSGRDMPKVEKEALLLSIEKWQTICDYYENGGKKVVYDGGVNTCSLCAIYLLPSKDGEDCVGCPVYNKTGEPYCRQTPYAYYYGTTAGTKDVALAHKYAKAELKFLQDLFKELYPND